MAGRTTKPRKDKVLAEREACAAYIEGRAGGYSNLLSEGKVSSETVDHVARVVALIGDDIRNGFHLKT